MLHADEPTQWSTLMMTSVSDNDDGILLHHWQVTYTVPQVSSMSPSVMLLVWWQQSCPARPPLVSSSTAPDETAVLSL